MCLVEDLVREDEAVAQQELQLFRQVRKDGIGGYCNLCGEDIGHARRRCQHEHILGAVGLEGVRQLISRFS